MMERHENAKITLNIQGNLLEMLQENEMTETIEKLQGLVAKNKIEIVGSAKFHPILPLIPEEESIRQIKANEAIQHEFFNGALKRMGPTKGFFPPEMAVSPRIADIVQKLDYKWMIMGGISNAGEWPTDYLQKTKNGLITFFRDTYLSNDIAFDKTNADDFIQQLSTMYGNDPKYPHYVITALDGETFGHHIKYYETSFLGKTFSLLQDRKDVQLAFVSELLENFPAKEGPPIRKSTWSTDGEDLVADVPYPLWAHPLNPLHKFEYRMLQALYKLMALLEKQGIIHHDVPSFMNYYQTARHFYDRALHSCWLWWSSMRPHWSPNLIYKGIDLIMKTALNAQLALINLKIGAGEEFYSIIMANNEKIMNEMVQQELEGQRVRAF